MTAIVTSLNPSIVQVAAGLDSLQFAPVTANSQVTSSNTFTLQMAIATFPSIFPNCNGHSRLQAFFFPQT